MAQQSNNKFSIYQCFKSLNLIACQNQQNYNKLGGKMLHSGNKKAGITILGEGTFGKVVRFPYKNYAYAIKMIQTEYQEDQQLQQAVKTENNLLKLVKHPNIMKMYGYRQKNQYMYILMEFLGTVSLKRSKLGQQVYVDQTWNFIAQITAALLQLQKSKVVHKDISPQNIMVFQLRYSQNQRPIYFYKLIDFGLSSKIQKGSSKLHNKFGGKLFYASPEMSKRKPYDLKSDIYSFGLLLHEIVNNNSASKMTYCKQQCDRVCFFRKIKLGQRKNKEEIFQKYGQKVSEMKRKMTSQNKWDCSDLDYLIKKMLSHRPEQRPSPIQILRYKPVFEKFLRYTTYLQRATQFQGKFHSDKRIQPSRKSINYHF